MQPNILSSILSGKQCITFTLTYVLIVFANALGAGVAVALGEFCGRTSLSKGISSALAVSMCVVLIVSSRYFLHCTALPCARCLCHDNYTPP